MKRLGLTLLVSLLLMGFSVIPSRTQEGPPSPKEIKACQKNCKETYKECVRNGGDQPLCEAAEAFCEECCTGGCRPSAANECEHQGLDKAATK
jgi:hypothetical protein